MKKSLFSLFLLLLCTTLHAKEVAPKGEFTDINVVEQNIVVKKLLEGNDDSLNNILKAPEKYFPPTLYALSHVLFSNGRKDEAMFWFYSGQLRARSDANKALDRSARQAVSALNQKYGAAINQYAMSDIKKLEETIQSVATWDEKTDRNYDPRWIALHGMDAFLKETISFEPKSKWVQINNSTRKDYLNGFRKAIAKMK